MKKIVKIRVFHGYYGCDTGCCGHIIEVEDSSGKETDQFEFTHPYSDDHKAWAIESAQKFIAKKFPECYDTVDWDTVEYKDVADDSW